jgi:hypothetical protein
MTLRGLEGSLRFTDCEAVLRFSAIHLPTLFTTLRMQSVDTGRIELAGYFVLAQSPLTVAPFEFSWSKALWQGSTTATFDLCAETSLNRPTLLVDAYGDGVCGYSPESYSLRSRGVKLLELDEVDGGSVFERSVEVLRDEHPRKKTIAIAKSHRRPRKLASFLAAYSLDLEASLEYPRAFLEQNIVEQAFYYITGRRATPASGHVREAGTELLRYLRLLVQSIEGHD